MGKMSKILTNVCTKCMQTKEAKKYKIAEEKISISTLILGLET